MGYAETNTRRYTVRDYLSWGDNECWEILDGVAYNMSPAPSVKHQRVSRKITSQLLSQEALLGECEFFIAPTDVVFDEFNVVQPDLFVVCELEHITKKNIQGAPELIIEIVSPSTSFLDRREKKALYERFAVKEYLLVYPELRNVERYLFIDGQYAHSEIFNWDEVLFLDCFDIKLNLSQIFDAPKDIIEKKAL